MDVHYFTPGLLQLYSKGVEDMFLTGDPTITFFKKSFNRYENFYKDHTLIEDIMVKWNDTYFFKIPKDIQYIGPIYLKITIPYFQVLKGCTINDFSLSNMEVIWTNLFQLRIFKSIELLIDNNIVEKLDYDTYIIYINYLIDKFTRRKFYKMIEINRDINNNIYFYLPIPHTFTLNPSSYLPVKMMRGSITMIKFTTCKLEDLVYNNNNNNNNHIFTNNVQPIINISYDYIIVEDKIYNNIKPPTIIYKCLYSYQTYIINKNEYINHINLYNRTIDLFLIITNNMMNDLHLITLKECDEWYLEYITNTDIYNIFSTIDNDIINKSTRYYLLSQHCILSKYDTRYIMYLDEKYLNYIKEDLNNSKIIYSQKLTILILYFTQIHFNNIIIKKQDNIEKISIQVNGINLINKLPASYYNNVIPYLKGYELPDNYYMYSFSYNSLDKQPNGFINLKLIKDLQIYSEQNVLNKNIKMKLCTYEYRILKIQNNIGIIL